MKIFKSKIIAVVLTLAMVLSVLAVPVAAAEVPATPAPAQVQPATAQEAADFLAAKDLLQGDNGDLMLDKELTREQMVVILSRLMGEEETAIGYETDNMTFTDVPLEDEYAPYIAWAQDNGITQGYDEETFGFGESLTAWQTKAFFVRALGYTETADEEIIAKADELNITVGSTVEDETAITRADMALLMSNTVYATNAEGTVLGETIGVLEPAVVVPPVPATLEVVSAKTATDSTVAVTFNRAVEDTSKVAFTLTGVAAIATTAAWNADKTVATLTAPSILLDGAYTVKAAGDTFTAGKDTAIFVVAKNGPGKVEFVGDKVVKTAVATASTLRYKVSDIYGTDVTKTTLFGELTVAGSVGSKAITGFTIDNEKGIMTLTTAALTDTDKTAVVTIVATKNGVVATGTATLTVADVAKVDTIVLNAVTFAKTTPVTTKIITGKATAAYIPVDAKDQYGNVVDTKVNFDAQVVVAKTDVALTLTSEEYTPDNSTTQALRYVIDTTGISVAKTVTVTVVSTLSGKSAVITLDIKKPAEPDKVSIGAPSSVVAAKDAIGKVVIPITALDQYGVQLTPDEIVSNAAKFTITGTSAFNDGAAAPGTVYYLEIATSGEDKGKIVNNTQLRDVAGTAVITIATGTSVATTSIDVKEAAYEYAIKVDKAPAANLLMGATTKMDYKFIDQYGRAIKSPAATKVTFEVSNVNVIEATDGSVTTAVNATAVESDATTLATDNQLEISTKGTEGTAKLTAKLYDDAGTSVISTVDTTVTVTTGVPTGLTFEIADIPTLVSLAGDGAVGGADVYARPIVLTAKDASGTTYAIPSDRIMSVTSNEAGAVGVAAGKQIILSPALVDGAAITAQDGYYVVAAQDLADAFAEGVNAPATKTATIKVVVSTDAGPKEITKTVTIAKEAPKAVKVVFADTALDATNPYALDADATEVTSITGLTSVLIGADSKVFVFEVDQYGVYDQRTVGETLAGIKATSVDRFARTLGYVANQLVFDEYQIKANEDVYVMYQAASGAYGTFTIRATDGAYDVTAPVATLPAATGATNDVDSLTATFSEALYLNGVAVADNADVSASFTAAGGAAITSATYDLETKTIAFVLATVGDTDTITHTGAAATQLKDAAGLAYAAKVYTYATAGTKWTTN